MKPIFKTINLFLLGIFVLPSFLLLFMHHDEKIVQGYYCDTNYFETGTSQYVALTVEYDTYSKSDITMSRIVPAYENVTQANSCAPMAATIAIAYYDVNYGNLIPNADVGFEYNGQFYYSGMTTQIIDIKEEIYTLMGTNTEAPGTSVAQFKTGMRSYVNQQGYSITYNSCGTSLSTIQSYLQQQQPVVVFFNSYRYLESGVITDTGSELHYNEKTSSNGHVAVCYGYRECYFTLDGNSWTEKYLIVSFGDGTAGLMDVTNISRLDDAYAISIY